MSTIPMHYASAYRRQEGQAGGVVSIEGHGDLRVGTPHDVDRYSPEHLLVAAAETCLANYVMVIARLSRLEVKAYSSTAEGELERDGTAGYRFKRILIRPELTIDSASESLAEQVLDKAHRSCLIARSLNCPVDMEPRIHTC